MQIQQELKGWCLPGSHLVLLSQILILHRHMLLNAALGIELNSINEMIFRERP